jgi:TonB family protein
VILDKLESGLLLFDTPQGYVAVEPSFRERVYLLWTFRNFRQLSLPLLNARQIALVKDLAGTASKLERYDALRVIGVVENFSLPRARPSALPAAMSMGAIGGGVSLPTISATATSAASISEMSGAALAESGVLAGASEYKLAQQPENEAEHREKENGAALHAGMVAADERGLLVVGEQELAVAAEQEPVVASQQTETVLPGEREIAGVGIAEKISQSMQGYWTLTTAGLAKLKPAEIKIPKFDLARFNLGRFNRAAVEAGIISEAEFKPSLFTPKMFKLAPARLATAAGVIALCLGTVAAWHRIEGVMGSGAYDQAQVSVADTAAQTKLATAKPAVAEAASALAKADIGTTGDIQQKRGGGESQELASIAPITPVTEGGTAHDQVAPLPARKIAHRGIVSTSKFPLATIENGIQATRPPLRFVYPKYADLSARGVVALTADVDASGSVRSVRVVKGNRSLAAAAISAVRKWRYRPYLKDGRPVATETNIVISFFSNDAITMSFPPSVAVAR